MCGSSKSRAGQILYCTVLQKVRHCFNIYCIPVYVTWCYDTEMSLRKTFLKNYCGLFVYTSPNCYVHINYVLNITNIKKININKQNLIFTSLKNILLN